MKEIIIDTLMATSGVRFGTSGARGRVVDITDEVAYAYTRAFLQASGLTHGRIALAIDLRPSSPRIAAACAAAIEQAAEQLRSRTLAISRAKHRVNISLICGKPIRAFC